MELILAYLLPKLASKIAIPIILQLMAKVGVAGPVANVVAAKVPEVIKTIIEKLELGNPLTPEEKKSLQHYKQTGRHHSNAAFPDYMH